MTSSVKLHTLIKGMTSEAYHGHEGSRSSSQLKDLIDDEDLFIQKYIHKTIEREETGAFDVGTYFHSMVLEPHKVNQDCAVYPGRVRRGQAWEKFQKRNKGKCIVTESQRDQAMGLVKAVLSSPIAQTYLEGIREVSLFTQLAIHKGYIYAPHFNVVMDRDRGWVELASTQLCKQAMKDGFQIIIKVRADNLGDTFISDLKSTSGNARSIGEMKSTIRRYDYKLSASLYLDMFRLVRPELEDFIWIFASKDRNTCMSYRATENNKCVGRAQWMRALVKMADCAANGWKVPDYLCEMDVDLDEMEWIKERDSDLL